MFSLLRAAAALVLTAAVAQAQSFPQRIDHKFGTTVIEAQPTRVATLDYTGADDLLALGVQPVALRYWYGDHPRAVWPWAEPLLTGSPTVLSNRALDFEAIAAAQPDVILALWSGISDEDYAKLTAIAPVVAVPKGVGDFELPWDQRALLAAQAIGREAAAQERITAIRTRLADTAAAHPEWQGKTAAVAYYWSDLPGAYTAQDIRPQVLAQLGFQTPPALDALADPEDFTVTFSEEQLSVIDGDLIVWVTAGTRDKIEAMTLRPFLQASQQGHEVFLDDLVTGAFSHASLLSLPYALDRIVPMIEAALAE